VFRPQKTVAAAAACAKRELKKLSRPAGDFDASRYFRGEYELGFYNTGTGPMRALAREIYLAQHDRWTLADAAAFADRLMPDIHLEVKSVGIEVVARCRKDFTPALLARCQRWLASDYSSNWATTDAMCGMVIGPLLVAHPSLETQMRAWSKHRNMWVRRASIVGLLVPIRRGSTRAVDLVYAIAKRLHPDPNDLIHKAVGWALREAGKVDSARLERYLRANVSVIPRTTFRYAIERFAPAKRKLLLALSPRP
jgi:3-methyladenine DNA glycosylase AlkD